MKKEEVESLFTVAGIPVLCVWELPNQYWPRVPFEAGREAEFIEYHRLREASPWWLVKTPVGMVKIGWRKRVISIDWGDTPVRKVVTEDDVTKSETMVHAWSPPDAAKYLSALAAELQSVEAAP